MRILREAEPEHAQIAYWPVADTGWDYSYINAGKINSPGAVPVMSQNAASLAPVWRRIVSEIQADSEIGRGHSPEDWDCLCWTFTQACNVIIDFCLADRGSMPESMHELLNGQFFINEDFLCRAAELVSQGESCRFELGVVLDQNILYQEFTTANGMSITIARRYHIGPQGYDIFDPARWEWLVLGLPEDAERVVLVSDEMLADYSTWLPDEDIVPLGEFYDDK